MPTDRIHVGACCPDSQLDNILKLLSPNGICVVSKISFFSEIKILDAL